MSDISLTARDIVMIMNRAAKLGVTTLSIGDLDISFSQNRAIPQESSISQHKPTKAASPVEAVEQKAKQQIIEQQAGRLEAFIKEEEEFLNAPVLNPVEWEEQQVSLLEDGVDEAQREIEDAESLQVQ